MPDSNEIIREMRSLANPSAVEGMARFGIDVSNTLGISVPALRKLARRAGRDQKLAEALWATGIREARILASLTGDPVAITRSVMDRWVRDFNSWEVCDACCGNLFDRSPHAWQKVYKWAPHKSEFVRRAAFSMLAGLAVHDKAAPDRLFLDALPLIEQYAFDERNFVRKAVNRALRNIGKRNAPLRPSAFACARRIRKQGTKSARWIAADALRELSALQ